MEPVMGPRVFSNRYELTHLIARGGMAQVYRAHDRRLDRPVALKVLFPELSVDRAFVERFRREAQAAANLSHPNIVPVFDWGEDTSTYFIVMEFVDGQPLSSVLRASGPLPPARVADVGANVANALAYAHRHGVIHRDVKPGNVLLTADGQVKVTDFGIARAVNTEESLTQTGAVMGTATYFSPEQAEGASVDARSDIYSLGVVLFEMATGRPPFLGETPVSVASKHVRDMPPMPRELAPSVPAALEAVIMTAMAKSPDDRYATAADLRADLVRFADGLPVAATQPVPATAMQQAAVGTTAVATTAVAGRTRAVPITEPAADGEQPEPEAEEAANRRQTRRLVLLLLALLVILGVVAYFLFNALSDAGAFSLPNVVNQQRAAATRLLESKGLRVTNSTEANGRAQGIVLASDPTGGASVKKGDTVRLVVSGGPHYGQVQVPNVVNMSLNAAVSALQSAGFEHKSTTTANQAPAGTVIAANPTVGSYARRGSTVDLTVSAGPSSVTVPSVLGQSQSAATTTLQAGNLAVGVVSQSCSNQYPTAGQVSSQSPGANAQEPPGTQVNLVVSTGPCSATVPSVTGASQSAATAALQSAGFANVSPQPTGACSPSQNGVVISQNPPGGTSGVQTSSTITLNVCSNSGTTTTTAPPPTTAAPTTAPTTSTTAPAAPAGGQNPQAQSTTTTTTTH